MTGTASDTATGVTLGGGTGTGDSGSGGNSGSSQTGTGTTPSGNAGGDGGSSVWYSTVEDATLKSLAETKGWKSPSDALKSYKELETAYSAKEGPKVPSAIDEYKFNVPSDIPKEAYNDGFANWFKSAALKNKMSVEQASAMHDAFVEYAKGEFSKGGEAQSTRLRESVQGAATDLEASWGKMDTPQFSRNVELARRAIRLADPGLMDALREVGVLAKVGDKEMVTNATVMKAFAKMGEAMYSEDRMYGEMPAGKNPFADDTRDLSMQGRVMKEDPAKAISLIRAAGKDKMFAQFIQRHSRT